jgi:hypothetical protein
MNRIEQMKWYSVKKYKPYAIGVEYIIRNDFGVFIARPVQMEYFYSWVDEARRLFHETALPTHFCIPDPIEIEED